MPAPMIATTLRDALRQARIESHGRNLFVCNYDLTGGGMLCVSNRKTEDGCELLGVYTARLYDGKNNLVRTYSV